MGATNGKFWYSDASIWRYDRSYEWEKTTAQHEDGLQVFLILLQQTVFWKVLTILQTVHFHVRGWEMSKIQREWITLAAVPSQRSRSSLPEISKFLKSQTATKTIFSESIDTPIGHIAHLRSSIKFSFISLIVLVISLRKHLNYKNDQGSLYQSHLKQSSSLIPSNRLNKQEAHGPQCSPQKTV